ncbi:hypothetical protein NUSPORA_00137 [Nucleospora cyclopteri]
MLLIFCYIFTIFQLAFNIYRQYTTRPMVSAIYKKSFDIFINLHLLLRIINYFWKISLIGDAINLLIFVYRNYRPYKTSRNVIKTFQKYHPLKKKQISSYKRYINRRTAKARHMLAIGIMICMCRISGTFSIVFFNTFMLYKKLKPVILKLCSNFK